MQREKELVRRYWDNEPCGTGGIGVPEGTPEYFRAITQKRDLWEYNISKYAEFNRWAGKKVLEVGCGVGSDLVRFAKAGAYVTGIDLSQKSVALAKERMALENCEGVVLEVDAEKIPYKDNTFDLVYSFGVLHHTPNIDKAINEIYRVTKSGGEICIMIYHKYSLVSLQMYLLFGLFALKPFRSLKDIMAIHHESVGTKVYSVAEVRQLFSTFKNLEISTVVTPYDLRYQRNKFLPLWVGKLIPHQLGWHIIVKGQK